MIFLVEAIGFSYFVCHFGGGVYASVAHMVYVLTFVHVYICRSLSTEDIEKVVGSGCPNLLRKSVNSAKRLRAHVRLDEGDVCNFNNL